MSATDLVQRPALSTKHYRQFHAQGYLILRRVADARQVRSMRGTAVRHLAEQRQPIEYEADVAYPGAPDTRESDGGDTARRLLQAYDRSENFAHWAHNEQITTAISQLLGCNELRLTRSHHNCVMTKHPGHSSATLWHQDLRYWSFEKPELINSWLALGDETPENGCMWLLPSSHRQAISPAQVDKAKFLRSEMPANQTLIASAKPAELQAGDVLLFHAGVFHAAGRNTTSALKLSTVFTYHTADNRPLPGSRSAGYESIPVS